MREHNSGAPQKPKRSSHHLLWTTGVITVLVGIAIVGIQIGRQHSQGMDKNTTNPGGVLAVITNSGSTNSPWSKLTINKDGSGSITYEKGRWSFGHYQDKTFSAGTFDSSELEAILTQINDVQKVPNHGCPKSASFGSRTTITYKGETSGDISCLSDRDEKIFQDLKAVVLGMYGHV
ncbi:MAG: hypothetical protein M3Z24_16320 [Chloroflexota bacterium]|nr:hypothetical protein [Chloroflexota bacterium]